MDNITRVLKIKKRLKQYMIYIEKANAQIDKAVKLIETYSQMKNLTHNQFAEGELGVIPSKIREADDRSAGEGTVAYADINDIINAINNNEVLDERWYDDHKCL
jgi:hypothetical protein